MDRLLISLKFTMLRHTTAGLRGWGWIIGGALVIATWTAVVLASDTARHVVVTLALAAWGVGAVIGPILVSGNGVLRPSYFALLPLDRRALGRGLLVSTFVGAASGLVLLTSLVTVVPAVAGGAGAVAVAVLAAGLSWVLVITLSRLVFALLGAAMRSKFGVEIAAIQYGLMFAAMFTGWMIVQAAAQSVPVLLRDGIPVPAVTAVLDALPTSWALLAVEAAGRGDGVGAAAFLSAIGALDAALVLVTVRLLVPREDVARRQRRSRPRSTRSVAGGGLLPATQPGAVVFKEVRQWTRDPWRSLEVRSAVWTGVAIGGFALASGTYSAFGAFAGAIVAFMLGLSACNVYGQDGTAVWQTLVGQDATSVRSDVRGRQWAAILVFAPQALLIAAIAVPLSGHWWTVPYVVAALAALFGAASGAAIVVSAAGVSPGVDPRMRVGPNDANGNIGVHVWIVMLLITIGVLPTGAAVVASILWPSTATIIAMVAVGVANGFMAAWLLGRVAIRYLERRMPEVYSRIRYGRVFLEAGTGPLAWTERATLEGEQVAREQKRKEREKRLARS
ncbi:ABC-2 type transport system permease protein [Diaminobutyricimonas aerilata]|uniref:ABC-2 type transport system permease protein n=1 Tax=Diaminobutyricimonas aerilata TaxID=1162967 RepID=A0A2M9CKP9_9MICO|nr:hypothetical protein [Diaminobutyricimonas aerilata]PJJ72462.1 ABC-2 type transport system permease protein [Diaminobutyricimonas aerilata]